MPAPHHAQPQQGTGAKPYRMHQQHLWEQNKLDRGITCALQHTTERQQTSHEEKQSRINSVQNNAQKSVV